ncbi:uncharacterized protein LOC122381486 isoform X2 [Amphibalanus amphitrite]|uniref:uncharacterized protein LOC122381486 isoform X2 n=1 Tax=Amphibalanus amphitrite TaxID=1232801 RepID=UPI001C9281C4|nr:uncharacterized protein LOC122381486 isoform X2 [Amphibalanus amphitrite]
MNDQNRSTIGTKLPTAVEGRPSVTAARPAVSGAALRQQLHERLQTPFTVTVLPTRTRRRGGTTPSVSVPPPSHRPDRLAQRPPAGLKPGRRPRTRGRCRRRRVNQTSSRTGSPARAAAGTNRSRKGFDGADRRKPRSLMYSRHIQGVNTRARATVRNDVRFIRDRVISPSRGTSGGDISVESSTIDTAAAAARDVAHSADGTGRAAAISANNGRIGTRAAANNAGADSRRQPSLVAAVAAPSCQPPVDSAKGQDGQWSRALPESVAVGGVQMVCVGTQTEVEDASGRDGQMCAVCRQNQEREAV